MADGFLSRWSRRKAGKQDELAEQVKEAEQSPPQERIEPQNVPENLAPPPVTLEDVEKIDRFAPDFSAFMQPGVDPSIQQAALKKMFTDPHFNVMDGLDIYIDDYSKPDPLPPGMLERMVQGDMLNLFRKNPELQADAEKVSEIQDGLAKPGNQALADATQSDLISTDTPKTEQSSNIDSSFIESDKKKT